MTRAASDGGKNCEDSETGTGMRALAMISFTLKFRREDSSNNHLFPVPWYHMQLRAINVGQEDMISPPWGGTENGG